jgi:glycosyltransferase involved in cell wall biosynthesis
LARTLKLLPAVAVETPHATALWKSLATRLGADPEKIQCVPHPIQSDIFKFDPTIQKKNQIISVGRWESYQKNLPLLLKTLRYFLDKNPPWTALVVGAGLPAKSPHPRITFLPPLLPADLARYMQESKIFLSTSRYESFGLAAVEAFLCGCRIEAPSVLEALAGLQEPLPSPNGQAYRPPHAPFFSPNQTCKSPAVSLRLCPDDFEGQKIAAALIAWAENLIGHQAFQ